MHSLPSDVLKAAPIEDLRRFRQLLAEANYTVAGHTELLSSIQLATPRNQPHVLRMMSKGTQLETLVLIFLFGWPVEIELARKWLAPVPLESLQEMGLLQVSEGVAAAQAGLVPFGDFVVAADLPDKIYGGAPSDVVMGMTKSTLELANITVRRKARNTLDFGTGSGIQAFLASAYSDQVYGVDCSRRALNFARFNAALNNISNVEIIEGNSLEAVAGKRFDLIVANPPFAVTPERRYIYRDSGMHLDAFAQTLVQRAPQFLEEGGFFQCQCDWVDIERENWQERLARWVAGLGCDAWIMRQQTLEPPVYAEGWIRATEQDDHATAVRLCEGWSAFYRRENVQAISTGFITLRRASGRSNWLRIDDAPGDISDNAGDSILKRFALRDFLERAVNDQTLLATKLRTSSDAHLATEREWSGDGWRIVASRARLVNGLPYTANIDSHFANLLAHCNGEHTLSEVLQRIATSLGLSMERLVPAAMPLVRRLIENGFLLPADMSERNAGA